MTHERDLERLLDTWFSDGPAKTPDRVMDAVADRIARQPQRPAWRLTWRHSPMASYLKPVAVAAAAILIAILGFNLVGGFKSNSEVAAPNPTPTPSPSATLTPNASSSPLASSAAYACDQDRPCSGLLTAGDHTSGAFSVPFTFTTPADWVNRVDINRSYKIDTPAGIATSIQVMTNNAIMDQTPTCEAKVKAGVGTSVQEIVDYLKAHPGLVTTAPVPATVGGFTGQSIDFTVAPDWRTLCPDDAVTPQVKLLTDTGVPPARAVGYTPDDRVRWIVLDVGGRTVIIELLGSSYSTSFDAGVVAAQPIIDSIKFTRSN